MKKLSKLFSFFLVLTLLLSLCAPAALAAEDSTVIRIRTAGDLAELSRQCALDSWSLGKTVLLEADIDLSGTDFRPIPTFGGTFDGQGHTITGLDLQNGGDVQGLFRYVQETGIVRSLTVEGLVHPTDHKDCVGGIAGSNRGTILSCTFRGTVKGRNTAGGIAGINEATGQLINCGFSGTLTGEHYAGGIAGRNLGSIVRCRNDGAVNITEVKSSVAPEDVDLEQLNSVENIPVCTDVGGIAGFSSGIIQSCHNSGGVGYPHVGYNIGGIVGRQSGYLDSCTNEGLVQGRKDVGGIAGQMEPQLTLSYDQTTLNLLWGELDTLESMLDQLLDDSSDTSHTLTDQVNGLTRSTGLVKDAAADLADAFSVWADGNLGQINDLSARVTWVLERTDSILELAEVLVDRMEATADLLSDGLSHTADSAELGADTAEAVARSIDALRYAAVCGREVLTHIGDAVAVLRQDLSDPEAVGQAFRDLSGALDALTAAFADAGDALAQAGEALEEMLAWLYRAMESAGQAADHLADTADRLAVALDSFAGAGTALGEAFSLLKEITVDVNDTVEELAAMEAIRFLPLEGDVTAAGHALDAAAGDFLGSVDSLSAALTKETDVLTGDLKNINGQIGVIVDLLRQAAGEQVDADAEDLLEDVSDQAGDGSRSTGKISACINLGTVEGDVNAAGIVGSMAIEYDFDPEDDLTVTGERTLSARYLARAVVYGCTNRGTVTAKKDQAGGIVGLMDLGSVIACEGYGTVSSTGGGYVGGIAGSSRGAIRDCWAMCTLSGKRYVGGIAGLGSSITGCRTLIDLTAGSTYVGAIAGRTTEDARLTGNLFVHHELAGIDGVSYAGSAEPVSYGSFCSLERLPEEFTQFQLTFTADGKVVEVIPFDYGGSLELLPAIPEKEAHTAHWPELDYSFLTFSRTVEAEYTPYSTALSDGQPLPRYLVSGSFSDKAEVGLTPCLDGCTVTVTDPAGPVTAFTLHWRLPGEGSYDLWVLNGGEWEQRSCTTDGSYLLLDCTGGSVTFRLTEQTGIPLWVFFAAAAALVIVIAVVIVVIVTKRKKKAVK